MRKSLFVTGVIITISILCTSACANTEVEDYAKQRNLLPAAIKQLAALAPKLDKNTQAFIDKLAGYDISLQKTLALLAKDGADENEIKFLEIVSKLPESIQAKIITSLTADSVIDQNEFKVVSFLSWKDPSLLTGLTNIEFSENNLKILSALSDLAAPEWQDYTLKNCLTLQGHQDAGLAINFLREPDKYKNELFNYNMSEIDKQIPELGAELRRLPDFQSVDAKDVEALEDILTFVVPDKAIGDSKSLITVGQLIDDEGIKDKRQYSTPLQALVWFLFDEEKSGLDSGKWFQDWSYYYYNVRSLYGSRSLSKLVQYAWKASSESDNYMSPRWDNIDEVEYRLNSPNLISLFVSEEVVYDMDAYYAFLTKGTIRRWDRSPAQVLKERTGVCIEHAKFALDCLTKSGYSYNADFQPGRDREVGMLFAGAGLGWDNHHVCIFNQNDDMFIISTAMPKGMYLQGPFHNMIEAANATYPGWVRYSTFTFNLTYNTFHYR